MEPLSLLADVDNIVLVLECLTNALPDTMYFSVDSEVYNRTEQQLINGIHTSKVELNVMEEAIEGYEVVECMWTPFQQRLKFSSNRTILGKSIRMFYKFGILC